MSVTVPGALAGWDMLVRTHGRRTLAQALQPAIGYARDGFPVSPIIAAQWADETAFLERDSAAAATFLPGGRAPKAGEWFRNPDYARTLQEIADQRHRHLLWRRARPAHRGATRGTGRLHHARRPQEERADLGDADLGAVPRLPRVGAAAEQSGDRRARDAAHPRALRPQGDGAQLGAVPASPDRGQEARLRRPRPVRRRRGPSRHARRGDAHRRVHRRAAQPSGPDARAGARGPGTAADAERDDLPHRRRRRGEHGVVHQLELRLLRVGDRGAGHRLRAPQPRRRVHAHPGPSEHRRAGQAAVPHA